MVCFGEGAGANILTRFAVSSDYTMIDCLIAATAVVCTCKMSMFCSHVTFIHQSRCFMAGISFYMLLAVHNSVHRYRYCSVCRWHTLIACWESVSSTPQEQLPDSLALSRTRFYHYLAYHVALHYCRPTTLLVLIHRVQLRSKYNLYVVITWYIQIQIYWITNGWNPLTSC